MSEVLTAIEYRKEFGLKKGADVKHLLRKLEKHPFTLKPYNPDIMAPYAQTLTEAINDPEKKPVSIQLLSLMEVTGSKEVLEELVPESMGNIARQQVDNLLRLYTAQLDKTYSELLVKKFGRQPINFSQSRENLPPEFWLHFNKVLHRTNGTDPLPLSLTPDFGPPINNLVWTNLKTTAAYATHFAGTGQEEKLKEAKKFLEPFYQGNYPLGIVNNEATVITK